MSWQDGFDASEPGLAVTKLQPPTLPGRLVNRSRLDNLLNAALADHVGLILASAPAGSGKSTLVASWLADRAEAGAWLQLESGDSDPARFWAQLADAIGVQQPTVADIVKPAAVASNGDEQVVVPAFVNELATLSEPLVVVIDDYHLIDNASVHEGVERLIELSPTGITFVMLTRVDPPIRLGRLRVRNQVCEIRSDDLRFDPTEATSLLSSDEEELDAHLVDELCGRTEGWAAGLVLAGLSLRRSGDPARFVEGFRGDNQLVVQYLTDEYLAWISDEHRQRLLEGSILDRFNGSLIDAVSDRPGGARWLSETATVNQLLISLDETGSWYRFHHLLRDLLRLEARQAYSDDQLGELHRRAAAWFESNGDLGQAVTHQLAAGDRQEAVRLMFTHGPDLIANGQIETLRALLNDIGDIAKSSIVCALLWGWCEFIGGRYSEAEEWVAITHELGPAGFDQTITAPLRMNIFLGRGDIGPGLAIAREMTTKDLFTTHTADLATVGGGVYMWAGQAAEARATLALAVQKSADEGVAATHILGRIYQAMLEYDDGTPDGARAAAVLALDTATELNMSSYYRIAPAYAIRARTAEDPTSALADVRRAVDTARRIPGDLALAYVLTICGDTLIDLDDDSGGKQLLVEARAAVDRCPDAGIAGRHLARIESRHLASTTVSAATPDMAEALTEREIAVLRYLQTTMSQRDIAAQLYVSLNTVKTHCGAIYRKLGVGNRKAAVQAARDRQLL